MSDLNTKTLCIKDEYLQQNLDGSKTIEVRADYKYSLPQIQPDIQQEEQTDEGPLYHVIIHNDDVTPMDFVINILTSIFELDNLRALHVMYTAHYQGSAYVQTLPKPEAVKRVGMAHMSARLNSYPLEFTLEPEK